MINMNTILASSTLFQEFPAADLDEIASNLPISQCSYSRNQVVAFEEDECSAIGIVLQGSIHIQRLFPSGKVVTIETFQKGDSFGEALVFSNEKNYPATLIAREDTVVLYIDKRDILALCTNKPQFLENFLHNLSNKVLLLNRKIKSLSFGSVQQKVANYLVTEANRQQSKSLRLSVSRNELAESLGIPRPSLSRELIAMKEQGWIDFDKKTIGILDSDALKKILAN